MKLTLSSFSVRRQFAAALEHLAEFGFVLLTEALEKQELEQLSEQLQEALNCPEVTAGQIKSQKGVAYASRNLIESVPLCRSLWKTKDLLRFLRSATGPDVGLVRGLYFDKHPERTWSLGWHKDLTIAVKENDAYAALKIKKSSANGISKPTKKAGVTHVEADLKTLQQMVTLRIRLDDVTQSNGPLEVIPGSHHDKRTQRYAAQAQKTLSPRGDILVMRPLLSHASGSSVPGTHQHRRIVHLEFASQSSLGDGFQWHQFFPAFDEMKSDEP